MNTSNYLSLSGVPQTHESSSSNHSNEMHVYPLSSAISQNSMTDETKHSIPSMQLNRALLPSRPPCPLDKERLECTEHGYGVKIGNQFQKMPSPPENIRVHKNPLEKVLFEHSRHGDNAGNTNVLHEFVRQPIYNKGTEYLPFGAAYTDTNNMSHNSLYKGNTSGSVPSSAGSNSIPSTINNTPVSASQNYRSNSNNPMVSAFPPLPIYSISRNSSNMTPLMSPQQSIHFKNAAIHNKGLQLNLQQQVYDEAMIDSTSIHSTTSSNESSMNTHTHLSTDSDHQQDIKLKSSMLPSDSNLNASNGMNNTTNNNNNKKDPVLHRNQTEQVYKSSDNASSPTIPVDSNTMNTGMNGYPSTNNTSGGQLLLSGLEARLPSSYKPLQNPLHAPVLSPTTGNTNGMYGSEGTHEGNVEEDENEHEDDKKKRQKRKAELARASRIQKKTKLDELEAENALLRKQLVEANMANANSSNIPGFDIQMTLQSIANCIIPALQVLSGHTKVVATINNHLLPALICDTPEAVLAALQKGVMATNIGDVIRTHGIRTLLYTETVADETQCNVQRNVERIESVKNTYSDTMPHPGMHE